MFIELLGRLDNLKLLIIDETNLHPKNLLKISEALNTLENLRYISAIQKTYNKKENFVKLIEVSKKIDIILKNNINVIYFALLDDENKQIKMFKNIQKEISKNMKCWFRRSVDIITIDWIKAIMDTNLDNFSDFESSASFVYIDQIRICLGWTLILNDSLFTNSYNKDFTYYLSQTHRVTWIEASDVSDTKIKHLFKLLLSENLNLKPIKKINFGKRNLDQKEFALLSMIVINFDEKFEGVKDFYWKDICRPYESLAPDAELVIERREANLSERSKLLKN